MRTFIILFIFVTFIFYFGGSFIFASFNIALWDLDDKSLMFITYVCIIGLMALISFKPDSLK